MSRLIRIFTVCLVSLFVFIQILKYETNKGRCPNLADCPNLPNLTLNLALSFHQRPYIVLAKSEYM